MPVRLMTQMETMCCLSISVMCMLAKVARQCGTRSLASLVKSLAGDLVAQDWADEIGDSDNNRRRSCVRPACHIYHLPFEMPPVLLSPAAVLPDRLCT